MCERLSVDRMRALLMFYACRRRGRAAEGGGLLNRPMFPEQTPKISEVLGAVGFEPSAPHALRAYGAPSAGRGSAQ